MLEKLKNNTDIIFKETKANCSICYQEHLCNILEFMKDFYPRLLEDKYSDIDDIIPGICKKIEANEDEIIQLIFCGLLICKRNQQYYVFDLSKAPSRSTGDSIAEPDNVFGPRDGFVENFKENIALIRTRVKDDRLNIDTVTVGRRSKTILSLLSIQDIHNDQMRQTILKQLEAIDIDAIICIDDVMSYFQKKHLFPTYRYVGTPDTACRRLYNGEFVLVIDRNCIAICLPTTLTYSSRLKIDALNIPLFSFFERWFVILSAVFSIFFCGILASFSGIQMDSLSLTVLSTLKVSQTGIYLPIFVEILIVLGMFELYYLIGFRQNKVTVSSTIVLIGGLIVGQNLISSGIAGVFIMTATAICFMLSFVVSSNVTNIIAISLARLCILFSSLVYGFFGVVIASIFLACYLYNQKTLGVRFFYPFLPFDLKGIHKFFLSSSDLKLDERDHPLKVNNKIRRRVE